MAIRVDATNTTTTLNGTRITDFQEGDFIDIAYTNPRTAKTYGIRGNVAVSNREDGLRATITITLLRYSANDTFLNTLQNSEIAQLINGSIKTPYERDGVSGIETYTIENATMGTPPSNTKNNTDTPNYSIAYVLDVTRLPRFV